MPIELNETVMAENAVVRAVRQLVSDEGDLFERDLNERTLTHCLAIHLMQHFEGYHVDCEYNRNASGPKAIDATHTPEVAALATRTKKAGDTNAVTAYPDIIVHTRRTNERNFVIIEAKKTTGGSEKRDRIKLKAFLRPPYGYRVGVLLLLETRRVFNLDRTVQRSLGPRAELRFLDPDGSVRRTVKIDQTGTETDSQGE